MDGCKIRNSVVRVGDGRGFVVEADQGRLIVTASHCLPHLPPASRVSFTEERTYTNILGRLDDPALTVWGECLFVDPVADIAVLGSPDEQALPSEADTFSEWIDESEALDVADVDTDAPGWLFSIEGDLTPCKVQAFDRALWIREAKSGIRGGMSGSPILDPDHRAVGLVVVSVGLDQDSNTAGGPHPRLTANLPAWLLSSLS